MGVDGLEGPIPGRCWARCLASHCSRARAGRAATLASNPCQADDTEDEDEDPRSSCRRGADEELDEDEELVPVEEEVEVVEVDICGVCACVCVCVCVKKNKKIAWRVPQGASAKKCEKTFQIPALYTISGPQNRFFSPERSL